MRENVMSGNGSAVSILLSGAELAEFKSSANLQLFWAQGGAEEPFESEVELRSKSGISVESSAVPFSLWNRSDCFDGFPAGLSSNAENRPRLLDSERFSASISPIVLKSRAVVEAEKQTKTRRAQDQDCLFPEKKTSTRHKHLAASMDETSFNQVRASRRMNGGEELRALANRDDVFNRSRRISKRSEQNPLPLPLPPGSPAGDLKPRHHRRHVSIDLRASPAAKFLVQIMPWEMPEDHNSSSSSFSGRHSSAGRCFVPFKWEEVPGKPKSLSVASNNANTNANNTNNNNGLNSNKKLRLPPRLQQVDHSGNVDLQKPVVSSSPTSILDHGAECSQSSIDSSSTSSPNAAVAEEIQETDKRKFQVPSKVRAFLALVIWTRRACEEKAESGCVPKVGKKKKKATKLKNPASYQSINSSWSPSPRSSWLRSYSGLEIHQRSNRRRLRRMKRSHNSWGLGKLTSGCNVVSRAVRFRWWRRSSGVKLNRKSVYKPLLCSVGDDSAAFACS